MAGGKVLENAWKGLDIAKRAANSAKEENRFVNNYRNVINENDSPRESTFSVGGKTSNKLTFRNANVGEKTGLQKISLIDPKGEQEDVFLIVPERESVGYGNIRGWGDPSDSFSSKEPRNMPLSRRVMLEEGEWMSNLDKDAPGYASNRASGEAARSVPITLGGVVDVIGGNAVSNNITKNKNSRYTGEDKAVGLGSEGQSGGQIFGMVNSRGEILTPSETRSFLKNLGKNGYKGVSEIEQPTRVQEHTGPAYVPGDILLGLLGLQPNRGAVGYTFKTPGSNEKYRTFIENLRKNERK